MEITTSTPADIGLIFGLYDAAIEFQKQVFNKHWKGFDTGLVEREIAENRQWKIMVEGQVACIFAITFEDKSIWKEKDQGDAIYIHRIVTNPEFRGRRFVPVITEWAKEYAKSQGLSFVRMDTWGDNQKLIDYYQSCGFKFLEIITPEQVGLPKHYNGITLSLFEIKI
ncbi:MAG: GNAT family N-acetyltransferase [Saprospiraceae bacterium]|nr:GNAT family N-acetyltransferase [Saprospiraceae bacterium]